MKLNQWTGSDCAQKLQEDIWEVEREGLNCLHPCLHASEDAFPIVSVSQSALKKDADTGF